MPSFRMRSQVFLPLFLFNTVDGQNPAPDGRWFIPIFLGFHLSYVVQDVETF